MLLYLSGAERLDALPAFKFAGVKRAQFSYKYLKELSEYEITRLLESFGEFSSSLVLEDIENTPSFEEFCSNFSHYFDRIFGSGPLCWPLYQINRTTRLPAELPEFIGVFGGKTHADFINFFKNNRDTLANNCTKVHGINLPNINEELKLPFFSLSSSAYTNSVKFGTTFEYTRDARRIHSFDNGNKASVRSRLSPVILDIGLNPDLFKKDDYFTVLSHSLVQWQALSDDISNYIPDNYWEPKDPGKAGTAIVRHKPADVPVKFQEIEALGLARFCNTCEFRPFGNEAAKCPKYQQDATCTLVPLSIAKDTNDLVEQSRVLLSLQFSRIVEASAMEKIKNETMNPILNKAYNDYFLNQKLFKETIEARKPSLVETVASSAAAGVMLAASASSKVMDSFDLKRSPVACSVSRAATAIEAKYKSIEEGGDNHGQED